MRNPRQRALPLQMLALCALTAVAACKQQPVGPPASGLQTLGSNAYLMAFAIRENAVYAFDCARAPVTNENCKAAPDIPAMALNNAEKTGFFDRWAVEYPDLYPETIALKLEALKSDLAKDEEVLKTLGSPAAAGGKDDNPVTVAIHKAIEARKKEMEALEAARKKALAFKTVLGIQGVMPEPNADVDAYIKIFDKIIGMTATRSEAGKQKVRDFAQNKAAHLEAMTQLGGRRREMVAALEAAAGRLATADAAVTAARDALMLGRCHFPDSLLNAEQIQACGERRQAGAKADVERLQAAQAHLQASEGLRKLDLEIHTVRNAEPASPEVPSLGIVCHPKSKANCLIDRIDPRGAAARAGLQEGHWITSINARPVESPARLNPILQEFVGAGELVVSVWDRKGNREWGVRVKLGAQ